MNPVAYPALAAAALLLAAAKPPPPIAYKITPVLQDDGSRALDVEMRLRGDPDGETDIFLPERLGRNERALAPRHPAQDQRREQGSAEATTIRSLRHRPGARLKIRYRIVSAYDEDPGLRLREGPADGPARLVLRPRRDRLRRAGRRSRAPRPIQMGQAAQRLDRRLRPRPSRGQADHARQSDQQVAIGGADLKLVRRDLRGAPLRVALLGEWSFTPDQLADTVAPIVAAEDAFWGDRSSPFLIAMAPLGDLPSGLSYTGTGRTDAFSIASTGAFELRQAVRFLAHEYMHSWVPIELGGMPEEDEARDYWFSEGFNDYLASKVLLRSGLWSLADWAADKNETLLRYGSSPAKTVKGEEIAARFWTDPAVQQVSYDRGHLLAAKLDSEIAARACRQEPGKRASHPAPGGRGQHASSPPPCSARRFARRPGSTSTPDLERYARRGEPLLLPADLFGDCARLVAERRREFDRGYDAAATRRADGIIAGVAPDGPAYAAGMRDGMRLVRREAGKIGDSTVEMAYRVTDGAGEKVIRFLPEGKAEFEVQRLELTAAGPEREALCRARLGGAPA